MSNATLAERTPDATAIEQALVGGDLSKLSPAQRVSYYNRVCESLGLNPLTKPFAYIILNGKLTLYALKDCTEQLRSNRQISIQIKAREVVEGCYVVTASAHTNARQDESIGAVPIDGLKGEARANAMMKAETKAKRRVTLSICGLGMLDESEVASIDPHSYSIEAPAPSGNRESARTVVGRGGEINGQISVASGGQTVQVVSSAQTLAASTPANDSGKPSVPNGAELGQLPNGAVLIARIDVTDTKNPNVKRALVTTSTGEQLSTIKSQLAALAEQCLQERCPVFVETEQTKWGPNLIGLRRVEREIQIDHAAPLTDADCPF